MFFNLYFADQGGGVAQVYEPEGEEPTEYPERGLRNDSGGMLVFLFSFSCFQIWYSMIVDQIAGKTIFVSVFWSYQMLVYSFLQVVLFECLVCVFF